MQFVTPQTRVRCIDFGSMSLVRTRTRASLWRSTRCKCSRQAHPGSGHAYPLVQDPRGLDSSTATCAHRLPVLPP